MSDYPGLSAHAGELTAQQLLFGDELQGISIPQQVIVPDVSFYKDVVDFKKMKSVGVPGVFIRVGQNLWPDPMFSTHWPNAKSAGLKRGTYWYYDSRVSPEKQADLYYSLLTPDFPEMEIVVDFEESYGGAWKGSANLKRFIERLLAKGIPEDLIAIYTGYYYWKDNGNTDPFFKKFKLWLAWYTSNQAYVSVPAPWTEEDLLYWQYTDAGDGPYYGTKGGIDLNYFNGTTDDYANRYNATIPVPQPKPKFNEYLYKIKPEHIVRAFVTNYPTNQTVEKAAQDFHATCQPGNHSIVINGDGWRVSGIPNGDWVSNGVWKHTQPKDSYSPRITFDQNNKGAIAGARGEYWFPNKIVDYNAFGLTRRLVKEGKINPAYVESGELNARTAFGFTPDGTLVIYLNDGWDRNVITLEPAVGRTIKETGEILIANEVVEGGDGDGGGSPTLAIDGVVVNSYNDDGIKVMRFIVNHLCLEVTTLENNPVPPEDNPDTNGGTNTMDVVYGKVLQKLQLRSSAGGDKLNVYLQTGDEIIADKKQAQWLHLMFVNNEEVTIEAWASTGSNNQYIDWSWGVLEDTTPTPDPEPSPDPTPDPTPITVIGATLHYSDGTDLEMVPKS